MFKCNKRETFGERKRESETKSEKKTQKERKREKERERERKREKEREIYIIFLFNLIRGRLLMVNYTTLIQIQGMYVLSNNFKSKGLKNYQQTLNIWKGLKFVIFVKCTSFICERKIVPRCIFP